ncbi:MAG: SAM-dependent methyltransferase [Candidatus Egerieousia sp.]|nr:SAM-dependent methyltransferase [Candidatus Egerieousia sp.]
MRKGLLYLIPSPIGDVAPAEVIPQSVLELLPKLNHFVVEELRTVRRYLSNAGLKGKIDSLNFYLLNEHTPKEQVEKYLQILLSGEDVGLISEAGLPAVADPGAYLVELAQRADIEVVPLAGPSSLMMALMASGLNGQCFAFNGYLPVKEPERSKEIKELERLSAKRGQSQIFIETPYRNERLLADFLQNCAPSTRLTVAADISMPTQFIKTKSIEEWRRIVAKGAAGAADTAKGGFVIGKRPCVFILLA